MTRDNLVRAVIGLLLAAVVAWLVSATEWAEVEVPVPAKGEAAKNRFYALQAILRDAGVKVVRRQALDALPPPGARLVLESQHWDIFPERADNLRKWVEGGGHLILPRAFIAESIEEWIAVDSTYDAKPRAPRQRPTLLGKSAAERNPDADCLTAYEPESSPATYLDKRAFRLCSSSYAFTALRLKTTAAALWSIGDATGLDGLRIAVGKGSVTVLGLHDVLTNEGILRADNALVTAAALQAGRGAEVWFVVEESRTPLMRWVWEQGWVALVLALLAGTAVLWRGAVRFGPRVRAAGTARRSMAEQVAGTAQFLQRHGAAALHRAQVRALDEAARRHLGNYAGRTYAQNVRVIALSTGLEPQALARAIEPKPRPQDLPAFLEILETARRRLRSNHRSTPKP